MVTDYKFVVFKHKLPIHGISSLIKLIDEYYEINIQGYLSLIRVTQ